MGADLSVVLEPRCPDSDDPAMADFLRIAATICGTTWVELTLSPEGLAASRRYLRGTRGPRGAQFFIDAGERYSASISSGAPSEPPQDARDALGASLRQLLENRDLRIESALYRGVINTSTSAALVFGSEGEIIFANPPADRLLSLQTEDELMAETRGEPSQPLFSLLSSFVDRARGDSTEAEPWQGTLYLNDGRFMAYEVSRIRVPADFGSDAVLVIVRPFGSGSKARVESFANRHELSPRQREVVQLLVEGLTTIAMADALGISPHTVRDHLKHLYRKTGANSRGELLGLISRTSPAKAGVG